MTPDLDLDADSTRDKGSGAERAPLLPSSQSPTEEQCIDDEALTDDDNDDAVNDLGRESDPSWPSEAKLILSNSIRLVGTYLLQYFYNLVIILVASRLGTDELAAISLGITTMNVLGFAVFEGMATSLDTLCAQAYGSGNMKLVGLHVQRMIWFLLLVAVPIGALWICSPWILAAIIPHERAHLAVLTGTFLRISLLGLPGYAVFEAGKRFMQAQGDFTASLVVMVVCAPINIFLNWLFVFHLHWAIPGAALAAAVTNLIRPLLLLLYILLIAPHTLQCWPGLVPSSAFHLKAWKPMISLSLPGVLMNMSEWFAFEILTFSTSYLGTADLAAQTFLTTISVLIWHLPFSVSITISTRIGFFVGRGSIRRARAITAKVYAPLILSIAALDVLLAALGLHFVVAPYFLADKPPVQALVLRALPAVAAFQFCDATSCCLNGILRGLGRQVVGGWVSFGVNYTWAVPLALVLELGPLRWGLLGLWIGLGSGVAGLSVVETVLVWAVDWGRAVVEARGREEVVVVVGGGSGGGG